MSDSQTRVVAYTGRDKYIVVSVDWMSTCLTLLTVPSSTERVYLVVVFVRNAICIPK